MIQKENFIRMNTSQVSPNNWYSVFCIPVDYKLTNNHPTFGNAKI